MVILYFEEKGAAQSVAKPRGHSECPASSLLWLTSLASVLSGLLPALPTQVGEALRTRGYDAVIFKLTVLGAEWRTEISHAERAAPGASWLPLARRSHAIETEQSPVDGAEASAREDNQAA